MDSFLPAETAADLEGRPAATIVGGRASISDGVQAEIDRLVGTVDRIAGADRYATAAAVGRRAVEEGLPVSSVWAASGIVFADALVAGPAVAADDGVLVLVDPANLDDSAATRTYVEMTSTAPSTRSSSSVGRRPSPRACRSSCAGHSRAEG